MTIEVHTEAGPQLLECGRSGHLHYRARDIGYGVEEWQDEYMYCGPAHGKLMFVPSEDDGGCPDAIGRPIYLFEDEILEWRDLFKIMDTEVFEEKNENNGCVTLAVEIRANLC